ncbi:anaerobic ribonucleoside-triphosphate reductase activating protein [Patescibacteria group bacterium]|nr:anaerobic ribonucleoside-triphosphate reductase activating protein [Patescibacteria group bacterium]MBU1931535.1 anaerobic ribonucleoside-triphosphate reductase activating protein [Patescibacteria group bacterium]
MLIGGLQKTTLIDFPGRVACTVFTLGCNFRCPFCHNKNLVTLKNFQQAKLQLIKKKDLFDFLKKRRRILDGVCITGGEPTLHQDLPKFCQQIKALALEVKLDTNGSQPKMLKKLIEQSLVDFVAMDIKTAFSDYTKAVAVNSQFSIPNLQNSIKLILQSGLEYEFRTTVVPGIHDEKTLVKLARELAALSKSPNLQYILQPFRPQNCLDSKFLKIEPFSNTQMKQFLKAIQKILLKAKLRGID